MIFGTRKHCASASGALLNACSVDSDACTWSGRKTLLCPGTVDVGYTPSVENDFNFCT